MLTQGLVAGLLGVRCRSCSFQPDKFGTSGIDCLEEDLRSPRTFDRKVCSFGCRWRHVPLLKLRNFNIRVRFCSL